MQGEAFTIENTVKERIEGTLSAHSFWKIKVLNEVGSTNTELKNIASKENEGYVIVALSQTEGRGRLTRTFYSPSDTGIYFSLLLKPSPKVTNAVKITALTAVAVCEGIEKVYGIKPTVKWVNDIHVDGKKVAGILTEGAVKEDGTGFEYAIVGIGINIAEPKNGFPKEIQDVAGAVLSENQAVKKEELVAEILNSFYRYYSELDSDNFTREYISRINLIGKEVILQRGNEQIRGVVLEVDKDCKLVLAVNEKKEAFSSGEITKVLKA